MKRTLSLLLLAVLLLTLTPMATLAATDDIKVTLAKELYYSNAVPQQPVMSLVNNSAHEVYVTIEVYDEATRSTINTQQLTLPVGSVPVEVYGFVYKPLTQNGEVNTYRYKLTTAGGYKRTLYFAQIMRVDKNTNEITYEQWDNPIFGRNTVTSFGPQFRVLTPKLTKKWYMFTPIDLSRQGRQTITLVGGNMYEVGEVYVDVYGDTVNVTYKYFYEGETGSKVERISEYLNFFPAYNTITEVEPEKLPSSFAFNIPFSIANNLGGDTNVLMFVRNVETFYRFPTPKTEMRRNYPNSPSRKAERGAMLMMMDPIAGYDLVNDHNYGN
ncbi:MAG: hypothetical protein GX650_03335 [Clostridiales bacterium]|jgi:hypothetical protein|nr:hypothetical protein [Clostridiales bacterium]